MSRSSQQQQFLALLERTGWSLVTHQRTDLDWWADEIWTIESQWRPSGLQLYVTFLREPETLRSIWAVGVARQYPTDRHAAHAQGFIQYRNVWEKDLPAFVATINALRAQAIPIPP